MYFVFEKQRTDKRWIEENSFVELNCEWKNALMWKTLDKQYIY